MTAIFNILVGLLALVAGGELLIRGARSLAQLARVPPKLVGLTVVAVGTSLPELSVSLRAAADGAAEVAVGNALGSNLFNIAVVLGLSALVCPLTTGRSETKRDWPWMMATLLLCWALASDGQLSRLDGALLTSVFLAFVVSLVVQAKRSPVPSHEGPPASLRAALIALGLLVAGIPLLAVGAGWFVAGATAVARTFDVSEAVIGLTIVAAGTSLPELVTSVVAAARRDTDLAVANVLGSNIFNVTGILGAGALVAPIPVAVGSVHRDFPGNLLLGLAVLPILITGWRVSRLEGVVLLLAYGGYVFALLTGAV